MKHYTLIALAAFAMLLTPTVSRAATLSVTTLADSGTGSLRAQITAASAGDTIIFANGLSGSVSLLSSLPTIAESLTIQGPGATTITIDGANAYRGFTIDAPADTVTISGLTFRHDSPASGNGGAIDVAAGTLEISDCAFHACSSVANGGAIAIESGASATIGSSTFDINSADVSGGALSAAGITSITNCTIYDNTAGDSGGAVDASAAVTLVNCTVSANSGPTNGGGLSNSASTTITNCIFYGDSSSGAVEINATTPTVTNSDINQSGFNGTNGNLDTNPLFATGGLDYYGGPLETIALQAGSPCLGAGTATGAPSTDERGIHRPNPPSMGAYDAPTVLTAITIAPAALPSAPAAAAYSQVLTASGGTAPYTYVITSGASIPGITLSSDGTLAGTPTAPGTYVFTVTATDSGTGAGSPFQDNQQFTLIVTPPNITITPATLPPAIVNTPYTVTLSGANGVAPYSNFHVTTGALPAGLNISGAGVISGTPTTAGKVTFIVQVTDSSGGSGPYTGAQSFSITVNPPITLSPASPLTAGTIGVAYNQSVTAAGGVSPYTFAVTTGNLPAGLTLASSGAITGTPTAAGSASFTITATDSSATPGPYTGAQAYTLSIGAPTITITPATLPNATLFATYSQALTASGGTAPYTYTLVTGTPPQGITLAANGTLSGTATSAGTALFTVKATDSSTGTGAPFTATQQISLTAGAPAIVISPGALPDGTVGVAYNQTMTGSGATSPYTFALASGSLPTGLSLSSSGALTGTPTAAGTFIFAITAADSSAAPGPYSGTANYSITVDAPTIVVTPNLLTAATAGQAYSQSMSATGGTAPYTFSSSAGLPPGLHLAANGTVSGTATRVGSYSFTITATDSSTGTGSPFTGSVAVTLNVGAPTLSITPATVPNATVGVAYVQALTGSGGNPGYVFSGGAGLPPGLSLSAGGTISGTPTASGTFPFNVTVTDSTTGTGSPFSATQNYSLVVAAPTVVITPTSLPAGEVDATYSQSLTASGGISPYTFGVSFGNLPPGLTLSTSGTLSGTPTTTGTYVFTVGALDSSTGGGPFFGSRNYSIEIDAFDFPAGLTLMSVPSNYSSEPVSTTFGYASPVLALWDPTTSTYDVSPAPQVASLVPGIGYWVRFPQPVVITHTGTPTPTNAPFLISLSAGWNMVGDPFPVNEPLSGITVTLPGGSSDTFANAINAGVIGGNVYAYVDGAYAAETELSPYMGYWVYANQNCTLSVPAPPIEQPLSQAE